MKIRKNEFRTTLLKTNYPEEYIKGVIQPFSPMIKRKELNVHIIRARDYE
jgi:hypothetical protein